ncbi:hypothetical protein [Hydrogenophaga sp. OTU3427]|uniref:hypothetical protein n=1 Tax=Hydrogenophaga sp. OTU3427 TaxID=3043856 RepID=UPI00313B3834
MKTLVWTVCALLALLWTGALAVVGQLGAWLAEVVASGQATDLATAAVMGPLPEALARWIDPLWLQGLQAALAQGLAGLTELWPSVSGLLSWLVPLLWLVWALGLVGLLALAGGLHWLLRGPATRR